VRHAALPGDLAVRQRAVRRALHEHQHRLALVGVGAAQAVALVGAGRVEDRIGQRALAHIHVHRAGAELAVCVDAVEAVTQPVVGAVEEHDRLGQLVAVLHRQHVVVDDRRVDGHAGLRAAIHADQVQLEGCDVAFHGVWKSK
jgi:hypothetical protein